MAVLGDQQGVQAGLDRSVAVGQTTPQGGRVRQVVVFVQQLPGVEEASPAGQDKGLGLGGDHGPQ